MCTEWWILAMKVRKGETNKLTEYVSFKACIQILKVVNPGYVGLCMIALVS